MTYRITRDLTEINLNGLYNTMRNMIFEMKDMVGANDIETYCRWEICPGARNKINDLMSHGHPWDKIPIEGQYSTTEEINIKMFDIETIYVDENPILSNPYGIDLVYNDNARAYFKNYGGISVRPSISCYAMPGIKNVIFNGPATVVIWNDGTKTVVKCQENELTFDPEKGLAMAIIKKINGNKGNYNDIFKKWIPEKEFSDDNC